MSFSRNACLSSFVLLMASPGGGGGGGGGGGWGVSEAKRARQGERRF